jgi:hypothetical protein
MQSMQSMQRYRAKAARTLKAAQTSVRGKEGTPSALQSATRALRRRCMRVSFGGDSARVVTAAPSAIISLHSFARGTFTAAARSGRCPLIPAAGTSPGGVGSRELLDGGPGKLSSWSDAVSCASRSRDRWWWTRRPMASSRVATCSALQQRCYHHSQLQEHQHCEIKVGSGRHATRDARLPANLALPGTMS